MRLEIVLLVIFVICLLVLLLLQRRKVITLAAEKKDLERDIKEREEKLEWVQQAKEDLITSFKVLSSDALKENTDTFFKQANDKFGDLLKLQKEDWSTQKESFEALVKPIKDELGKLESNVNILEEKREKAYGALDKQLETLGKANEGLHTGVTELKGALTNTSVRGKWGEIQLRKIVELCGMVEHVDFDVQVKSGDGRPDMIVKLPDETIIAIDSKVPLDEYLVAMESKDNSRRKEHLTKFSRVVKSTVSALSKKNYPKLFERSSDFVVMFIPIESALSAAFNEDQELLEMSIEKKVLIASPVTLVALMKTVAYGWQQFTLEQNQGELIECAKEVFKRLDKFLEYFGELQNQFVKIINTYNKSVGSLESRLYPKIRELQTLGVVDKAAFGNVNKVDQSPRSLERQTTESE